MIFQGSRAPYEMAQPYDWGRGAARVMNAMHAAQQQRHEARQKRLRKEAELARLGRQALLEREAAGNPEVALEMAIQARGEGDVATADYLDDRVTEWRDRAILEAEQRRKDEAAARDERRVAELEAAGAHARLPEPPEPVDWRWDDLVHPETGRVQPARIHPETGEIAGWIEHPTGYPPAPRIGPAPSPERAIGERQVLEAFADLSQYGTRTPREKQAIRTLAEGMPDYDVRLLNDPTEEADRQLTALMNQFREHNRLLDADVEAYRRIYPMLGWKTKMALDFLGHPDQHDEGRRREQEAADERDAPPPGIR